jgi:lauroyl/myristoyl acyltransferase
MQIIYFDHPIGVLFDKLVINFLAIQCMIVQSLGSFSVNNKMNFQDLANSKFGVGFVMTLGRIIPPETGYHLAEWIAGKIASHKNIPMVKAVRSNQWIVSGKKMDSSQLDAITLKTFQHTADCLYDLYHYLPYPEQIMKMVTLSPKIIRTLNERLAGKKGTIILAPHMSNFDLAGRVLALHNFPVLVLSYPQPPGGYQWQNKMRRDYGIEIIPMSLASLRTARERLNNGGLVLTGMDRPLENSNHWPRFFGYNSPVPVTYVSLAAMTNSDFVVASCLGTGRGAYSIDCSDIINFIPNENKNLEFTTNAEMVLKEAQRFISSAPEQWSMFYPVWPWTLNKTP